MSTMVTSWEDEENNRSVELSVAYRLEDDRLEILEITPTAVTFVDPVTNEQVRSIGVWTEKGRQHLIAKYEAEVGLDKLRNEIEEGLLATAE